MYELDMEKYADLTYEEAMEYCNVPAKPTDSQVGGAHYKTQKLQPFEACYLRYGYQGLKASVHTKVDKYLTRKKDDELEQIDKAIHCLQILREYKVRDAKEKG